MAEYDLTRQLSGYLDHHMTLALLESAQDKGLYKPETVMRSKLKVLEAARFFDAMKDVYQELGVSMPEEVQRKEAEFNAHVDSLGAELSDVYELFAKQEVIDAISASYSNPDPEKLTEQLKEHGFKPDMLETMYKAGRAYYDLEQYDIAGTMLYNYRPLASDPAKRLSALWGRLAVEIMLEKFESAKEVLTVLESNIKEMSLTPLKKLQQRAWLMHWSLFIFFFGENSTTIRISEMLEHFLPKYGEKNEEKTAFVSAIQTACPHLVRYFAAVAIITAPKRPDSRDAIRDIVRMIRFKTADYSDPITQLLESVYIDFDFEKALETLTVCEKVLDADFFLNAFRAEFVEAASKIIFEVYCKIHSTISIQFVSERLNKSSSEAEKWIVDLIQSADLSARIEQAEGYVKMLHEPQSTYDQVLDSTRSIPLRTRALLDNFHRRGTRKPYHKKKGGQ